MLIMITENKNIRFITIPYYYGEFITNTSIKW